MAPHLITAGGISESFCAELTLAPCDASSQEVLRNRGFFRKFRVGRIVFVLHLNEELLKLCKPWTGLFIFLPPLLFSLQHGSKALSVPPVAKDLQGSD